MSDSHTNRQSHGQTDDGGKTRETRSQNKIGVRATVGSQAESGTRGRKAKMKNKNLSSMVVKNNFERKFAFN